MVGLLGTGGMGAVYRAEHLGIHRPVAIKVLQPDFANDANFAARFEREAQAAGRMQHPNCVAVSDFGKLDDGSLYLVMELAEGVILADVLAREGALEVRRALKIIRHILKALGHVHALSVVHRDVKPDNVILVETPEEPEFAKLLDFGIAKIVGENAAGEQSALTTKGTTVGTPHYLSPEQALGRPIDARADFYSTTAMLFELLTAVPPYDAANPLNVLRMHVSNEIPKLGSVVGWQVPPALEDLLAKGLAKKPDDRFFNATEYIRAIDDLLHTFESDVAFEPTVAVAPKIYDATTVDDRFADETPTQENSQLAARRPDFVAKYWPVGLAIACALVALGIFI